MILLAMLFNLCLPWSIADCDHAWTNASAHVAWSLAVPAVAELSCGKNCRRIASAGWILSAIAIEDLTHSKARPDERRTDYVSKLLPCLIFNLILESKLNEFHF